MRLYKLLLVPCIAIFQTASALDVTSSAGKLGDVVENPANITTLTVNGEVNAADFAFIVESMTSLTNLNLKDAHVVAYDGEQLTFASTKYPAAELSPFALAGCKATSITLPESITSIGEGALSSSSIKTIEIPSSVKSIGLGAFSNCDALESITIPATVSSIGTHLMLDCDNLKSVTYNASVTDIPASTFEGCDKLSAVTFGVSASSIGDNAFKGCAAMTQIQLGGSIKSIGASAFQGSGLTGIDLKNNNSLATIGDWAFAQCEALVSATLPNQINALGRGVFFGCDKLVSVNIPTSVTEIPDYAFNGAISAAPQGLSHDNITTIGDYALRGIEATTYTIPASLEQMGDYAMENWSNLTSMTANTLLVPSLGIDVWAGVNQHSVELIVNDNLVDEFKTAEQWQAFNIRGTTGIEDVIYDNTQSDINVYFIGTDMVIKASQAIASVRLYDSTGRQLINAEPASEETSIDTSAWDCHIYIVAVMLNDGNSSTTKIARR